MPQTHTPASVVAPGGGSATYSDVYAALGQEEGFDGKIIGKPSAAYNPYPALRASAGAPDQNFVRSAVDIVDKVEKEPQNLEVSAASETEKLAPASAVDRAGEPGSYAAFSKFVCRLPGQKLLSRVMGNLT